MISIPQETLNVLTQFNTQFNLTMGQSSAWADVVNTLGYVARLFVGFRPPPLTASRETLMKRTRYRGGRKAKRAMLRLGMRYMRVDDLQTGEPCRFCGMKTVPPDVGYILCPSDACLRETHGRFRGLCVPENGWRADASEMNAATEVGVDGKGTSEGQQDHG